MNNSMTLTANRFNIKWLRIIWMMIMFSLFYAISAFKFSWWFQFACYYSVIYSIATFYFLWMGIIILSSFPMSSLFALRSFIPLFIAFIMSYLSFFSISIFLLGFCFARFALEKISIFSSFTFGKLESWFGFFASTTYFNLIC